MHAVRQAVTTAAAWATMQGGHILQPPACSTSHCGCRIQGFGSRAWTALGTGDTVRSSAQRLLQDAPALHSGSWQPL